MNDLRTWAAELGVDEVAWLELLVKTTLVLIVARLLHASLWRANPRWQRLLWRTTALGVPLVAASFLFPPIVSWSILPAPAAGGIEAPAALDEKRAAIVTAHAPVNRRPDAIDEVDTLVAAGQARGFDFAPQSPLASQSRPQRTSEIGRLAPAANAPVPIDHAVRVLNEPAQTSATSPPNRSSNQLFGLPVWVAAIWFTGAVMIFARTVVGIRRLGAIRNRAEAVPAWVTEPAAAVSSRLGCSRSPEVLQTAEIASPCIMGVRRPVILLPKVQCESQYRHELPAILAHEIAHLRGRDVDWQLLLHAVAVVWWFHPLAWRMRSAHAAACDAVCDAVAANHVGDVAAYGRTLARLAIRVMVPNAATGMAMAHTSSVRRRIESLQRRVFPFGLSRGPAICAVAIGLAMFGLLGTCALTHAQAELPPSDATPNQSAPTTPVASELESSDMVVQVVDQMGQPVADAAIRFRCTVNGLRFGRRLRTDESGSATLELPADPKIHDLWLQCEKPGLVPIHYNWQENRAKELPRRLQLQMTAGTPVSGVVQREDGRPIDGADVAISMPMTWPRLVAHGFTAARLKTDAQGRWHWSDAPLELSGVSVRATHPDYRREYGTFQGRESLLVLKQGPTVLGRVTGIDGNPIRDAVARAGFDRFGTDEPESNTDKDGRFVLVNCKPGPSLVTIQADGYAPQFQKLTIGPSNDELHFKLEPGSVMRIRVVDVKGEPIPGVHFATDTWRGYRSLELRMQTDAEGRVEWRSAPRDAVLCDLWKAEYMRIRLMPIKAGDEETVITLPDELVISGKVIDATTGKPIPEFGVRSGILFQHSDRVSWSPDEPTRFTRGTYRFKIDSPQRGHLLEFIADGYKPAQSRPYKPTDGGQRFDVKLQPGGGPTGIVLKPDGEPAAGAEVAVTTKGYLAGVVGGRLSSNQSAPVFKADEAGKFTLALRGDDRFVLTVVHDAGYAEHSSGAFKRSNQITLEAWGRIEGRVMRGRRPDVNCEVSFWPQRSRGSGDFAPWYTYTTKTDTDGRFTLDRVIPGRGMVARVVVTQFIRSSQHSPCWQVPVDVPPDGAVSVLIGGTGRPVTGQAKLDRQPDFAIDWTSNTPATINLQGERLGPATRFRCAAKLDRSGRFRIPDVPAGKYELRLDVNDAPRPGTVGPGEAIGRATLDFEVPPMTDNRSDEPLDLGTVTATLFDTLDPGEQAPEFDLPGLNGGTIRLSEFRGKLVLLDFWSTFGQACLDRIPVLREIHEQHGGNPRFAMISLACDQQAAPPRRYVEENSLAWTHAHAGVARTAIGNVAPKYTVRSLPGTFLIGPDGRVLAKDLHGEDLGKAIATALEDDELFEAAKQ